MRNNDQKVIVTYLCSHSKKRKIIFGSDLYFLMRFGLYFALFCFNFWHGTCLKSEKIGIIRPVSTTNIAEMFKRFKGTAPALHLTGRLQESPAAAKHVIYLCHFTLILIK